MTIAWSKECECSFYDNPKPREDDDELQRVASKPSKRVGCTAYIRAIKKTCDERILVSLDISRSGHRVNTLEVWSRSRLSPAVRDWLQKAVATVMDWKMFKTVVKPHEA